MFKLNFDTDNAAFSEDNGEETDAAKAAESARILREVAKKMDTGLTYSRVFDVNGNAIGDWRLS
jgi:hypothetical protein